MEQERLQKYMAKSGVASRRHSEELIRDGKVTVNGIVITEMGYKVSTSDIIKVDGIEIAKEEKKYYVMNKPDNVRPKTPLTEIQKDKEMRIRKLARGKKRKYE